MILVLVASALLALVTAGSDGILSTIVEVAVLGLVAYLVRRFIPLEPPFKDLIVWILVIVAVILAIRLLLSIAGVGSAL